MYLIFSISWNFDLFFFDNQILEIEITLIALLQQATTVWVMTSSDVCPVKAYPFFSFYHLFCSITSHHHDFIQHTPSCLTLILSSLSITFSTLLAIVCSWIQVHSTSSGRKVCSSRICYLQVDLWAVVYSTQEARSLLWCRKMLV